AFTDTLPAGVVIAPTPNAASTCGVEFTLSAMAGGGTIDFSDGEVAAGTTCTVSVDVTSDTADTYDNLSGDLTSSAGNSGTAAATLTVQALGTIVIEKVTVPAGGTGFDFMDSVEEPGTFTLDDGQSKTFTDVDPDTYEVTENDPSGLGFLLTDLTCVDSDGGGTASSGDVGTRTATIELDPGETVTCTFTNSALSDLGFSKVFDPDTIGPGSTTQLRFDISNIEGTSLVTDVAFTDVLPAGITLADPPSAFTDCIDGVISITAPDTISLTGGKVGADEECSVTVNVVGTATATNTSDPLTSSDGVSDPAVATLTVDATRVGIAKSFAPGTIPLGATSTLTFDLTNDDAAAKLAVYFTDPLPAGMVVATPTNVTNSCGGVVTAAPGTSLITLSSGFIAGMSSCAVSVDVTTTDPGVFVNITLEVAHGSSPQTSGGFATAALDV
ncbi:MAG: hypothetical protein GY713_05230, partial [Actinomycetia bacterium]|nr:hypothetical protein [Actinomycetes bacterium]